MSSVRHTAALALGALGILSVRGAAQSRPLPLKYDGGPTSAAITPADLMTRLYRFADDSLMGREVGTPYHLQATDYIEREVRRLGLLPGGDNGTYFQNLPVFSSTSQGSAITIAGTKLAPGRDFLPVLGGERRVSLDGVPVVYGGTLTDTTTWLPADAMAGKVVYFDMPANVIAVPRTPALRARIARAAAVLAPSLDRLPATAVAQLTRGTLTFTRDNAPPATGAVTVYVTPRVGALLFGAAGAPTPGTVATGLISGTLVSHQVAAPARNVVAILPGADARLKGEFVAIGAHNDHIGYRGPAVDHDSIRALNMIARVQGADSPAPGPLTAAQAARLRTMIDSLHALHGGARPDSIFNGADDDGTGTVSVLEIAEAFAKSKAKPKRSILFVWHAGEEKGLWGSEYFTDHPTVPRDSIVAQLNMDMVGRGAAADVTGELKEGGLQHGGPGYLQLVGSRRLSTELGDLMETVNRSGKHGFTFDYSQDVNGHPQNIYCRSDHYEYARYGIPIVFMTTGGHSDYHQVTDEPQYIDYGRMAKVAKLVYDAAWKVSDLDHRIVVDKEKPDPKGRCAQ